MFLAGSPTSGTTRSRARSSPRFSSNGSTSKATSTTTIHFSAPSESDGLGEEPTDDEEEERLANDRRGQLTNLTREILHESPHYRELVAHYRRRMGDPDYDPDASEEVRLF